MYSLEQCCADLSCMVTCCEHLQQKKASKVSLACCLEDSWLLHSVTGFSFSLSRQVFAKFLAYLEGCPKTQEEGQAIDSSCAGTDGLIWQAEMFPKVGKHCITFRMPSMLLQLPHRPMKAEQ